MKLAKRLRNLWMMSNLPDEVQAELRRIISSPTLIKTIPAVKGEFLPDMTEEELTEYRHNEEQGWGAILKKWGLYE